MRCRSNRTRARDGAATAGPGLSMPTLMANAASRRERRSPTSPRRDNEPPGNGWRRPKANLRGTIRRSGSSWAASFRVRPCTLSPWRRGDCTPRKLRARPQRPGREPQDDGRAPGRQVRGVAPGGRAARAAGCGRRGGESLPFRPDRIRTNTLDAHRLLHLAAETETSWR